MSQNEPTVETYLSKSEVSMLLVGLNFSLERHYTVYDDQLPEELIELTNKFMDLSKKFKFCRNCGQRYAIRWSTDTHECPPREEE